MTNDEQDERIIRQSLYAVGYTDSEINLGVTRTYERNRYVDAKKMSESKQNAFDGKKTTTTYTGDVVHINSKAAKNKYKSKASLHQSDTDHTIPVKHVYDRHKNSAWLSDDDLKEVINAKSNLKEVSRYLNRSKRDMTNFEYIAKNWKNLSKEQIAQLGKEQIKADVILETSIAVKKVQNISATAGEGAKNALKGATPGLLLKGAKSIQKVGSGEMDAGEAIEEMVETTGKVAVAGAMSNVIKGQTTGIVRNVNGKMLNNALDSSTIGKIAGTVMVLKDAAIKFARGEIQSSEFFTQVIEDGAGYMLSTMIVKALENPEGIIAIAAGNPAGVAAAIALAVVTTVVQNVYEIVKEELRACRKSQKDLAEAAKVSVYIQNKEKKYQEMLMNYRNMLEEKREKAFDQFLVSIRRSVLQNDIDSFFKEINTFGESYGVHFQFATFQEFDDFMNDEEAVFQF